MSNVQSRPFEPVFPSFLNDGKVYFASVGVVMSAGKYKQFLAGEVLRCRSLTLEYVGEYDCSEIERVTGDKITLPVHSVKVTRLEPEPDYNPLFQNVMVKAVRFCPETETEIPSQAIVKVSRTEKMDQAMRRLGFLPPKRMVLPLYSTESSFMFSCKGHLVKGSVVEFPELNEVESAELVEGILAYADEMFEKENGIKWIDS